jgi:tetrahydromethanopterin S-methyltransferase subunit F
MTQIRNIKIGIEDIKYRSPLMAKLGRVGWD